MHVFNLYTQYDTNKFEYFLDLPRENSFSLLDTTVYWILCCIILIFILSSARVNYFQLLQDKYMYHNSFSKSSQSHPFQSDIKQSSPYCLVNRDIAQTFFCDFIQNGMYIYMIAVCKSFVRIFFDFDCSYRKLLIHFFLNYND